MDREIEAMRAQGKPSEKFCTNAVEHMFDGLEEEVQKMKAEGRPSEK